MNKDDQLGSKKNPSWKGLPYRGQPMIVDNKNQPVLGYQVHVKRFDLSDEDQLKEYTGIIQRKTEGLCDISFEERQYIPETTQWVVLLRWFDIFYKSNKENL